MTNNLIVMKKIFIPFLTIAIVAMTGCASTAHLASNSSVNMTNVQLSQSNFEVVKTVKKQASQTYIFGIGGLSRQALQANSYADMLKEANLQGSQALVNVQTEVKSRIIAPFYVKKTITTIGQVVEFKK